jgi:hypothetical protein
VPTEKLSNVEILYSLVQLNELNTKYAVYLNWTEFINTFLNKYSSNEKVQDNDKIILMGLDYFINLNNLVKEFKISGKEESLKLFVLFHLIKFSLPLLSKEYRSQFSSLGEALTGNKKNILLE